MSDTKIEITPMSSPFYRKGDEVEIVRRGVIVEVDPKDPARFGIGRPGVFGAVAYFRTDDDTVQHRLVTEANVKTTERADSEKTISDELCEAAAKLRKVAAGATPGRWVCGDLDEQKDYGQQVAISTDNALVAEINLTAADAAWNYMRRQAENDGQWIALASPALAEPLASWLEKAAVWADETTAPVGGLVFHDACDGVVGQEVRRCDCFDHPLAVARVLNGTSS